MDKNRAFVVAKDLLEKVGFREDSPDPILAWSGMKLFSAVPVPRNSTNTLFEIGNYEQEGTNLLYVNIVRQFEVRRRGEFDYFMQLRVYLTSVYGSILGGDYIALWSSDFDSLEKYFATVEDSATFKRVMPLSGWVAEVCFDRV